MRFKNIFSLIITVFVLFSIPLVSAVVKKTFSPIYPYHIFTNCLKVPLPLDINHHISSFNNISLFKLPEFLDWTFHISDSAMNGQKYTTYSYENHKKIYEAKKKYCENPKKNCLWSRIFKAMEEKMKAHLFALPSDISLTDIPYQRINDCIRYCIQKGMFKNGNETENHNNFSKIIQNSEQNLPKNIFLDELYYVIQSFELSANNYADHAKFMSLFNDKNNTIALLPILKDQLIIILRKTEMIFVKYQWRPYIYPYIITDLFSLQITISNIRKKNLSYGILMDEQTVSIIIHNKNKDKQEIIALIQGSIPNLLITDKKNTKSLNTSSMELYRKENSVLAFNIFYKYLSNIKPSFHSTYRNQTLGRIKKIFANQFDTNIQPFLDAYRKNTKVLSYFKNMFRLDKIYKYNARKHFLIKYLRNIFPLLTFLGISCYIITSLD